VDAVHTPVLLRECLNYLGPEKGQEASPYLLIDSTLGEGGHSEAFLQSFAYLRIIGLDADSKIQARARERLARFGQRMIFYTVWFNDFFANFSLDDSKTTEQSLARPNAILFDLGVSLFHYEKSGRGFSFRDAENGPLDMRLSPETQKTSAADIVNGWDEKKLADLIYAYSEERFSRKIARAIVLERQKEKIVTAGHLARVTASAFRGLSRSQKKLHPATKTFQAIRIAVNGELERLSAVLVDSFNALDLDGKLGVITFHSLEDRIVKIFFRSLCKDCICAVESPKCICGESCAQLLTKKAIAPSTEETRANAPSRSAKLRVIKKTGALSEARLAAVKKALLTARIPKVA
jgi:16S rRNA (cytosine1402-N4)-methyltransferase